MIKRFLKWLESDAPGDERYEPPTVVRDGRDRLGPIPDVDHRCTCGSVLRLKACHIEWVPALNGGLCSTVVCPVCGWRFLAGEVFMGYPHGPWPFLRRIGDTHGIDTKAKQEHEAHEKMKQELRDRGIDVDRLLS